MTSTILKKLALTTLAILSGLVPFSAKAEGFGDYWNRIHNLNCEEVIEEVTFDNVDKYLLSYLNYKSDDKNWGEKEYRAPFCQIHKKAKDDCEGMANTAAAVLSDEGYPPLTLTLYARNKNSSSADSMKKRVKTHEVFIYQEMNNLTGAWGSKGGNPGDFREGYNSLDELARSFSHTFGGKVVAYLQRNLDEEHPNKEWIFGTQNLTADFSQWKEKLKFIDYKQVSN